jgi:hypothetical protein
MKSNGNKTILVLSLPLVMLVALISCTVLFIPGFYSKETPNWQVQSTGQDMVDLILAIPVLLITSVLAYRNNKSATLLWGGVLLYLFYTFVIYCFDVHFNRLFIFYCIILGLLFYSLLYFIFLLIKHPAGVGLNITSVTKITGVYFILVSALFYILWLSAIIPAIAQNTTPQDLAETGLPTNPVHVIDLSVILPGIFIVGILLLRKKLLGYFLAPVMLTFFILMDITIGTLIVLMKHKGMEADISITFVMGFFALVSIMLLYFFLMNMKKEMASEQQS